MGASITTQEQKGLDPRRVDFCWSHLLLKQFSIDPLLVSISIILSMCSNGQHIYPELRQKRKFPDIYEHIDQLMSKRRTYGNLHRTDNQLVLC